MVLRYEKNVSFYKDVEFANFLVFKSAWILPMVPASYELDKEISENLFSGLANTLLNN